MNVKSLKENSYFDIFKTIVGFSRNFRYWSKYMYSKKYISFQNKSENNKKTYWNNISI